MSKQKNYRVKGHLLYNALPHVWKELQQQNNITGIYKKKARYISLMVYLLVPLQLLQKVLYHKKISKINLNKQQPIFILGHWRSGTTHLHYLMHKDDQYGTLSNYQSFLYNVALLSKTLLKFVLSPLMPSKRPQDNIQMSPDLPAEEEQPFSVSSTKSGFHTWNFPLNQSYFRKFNLFEGITPEEKQAWKEDYHFLLQNITYFNNGKQLVLKNPHNTSRIKELLELYPNAKFINLHRNPYDVIQSTRHLHKKIVQGQALEFFSLKEREEMVLEHYRETMKKNINELNLIPKGNVVDVRFDDLEEDSIKEMEKIYTTLGLPNFNKAKPKFEEYLSTVKNYKKNKFRDFKPEVLNRINHEMKFVFDFYGYEIEEVNQPA